MIIQFRYQYSAKASVDVRSSVTHVSGPSLSLSGSAAATIMMFTETVICTMAHVPTSAN